MENAVAADSDSDILLDHHLDEDFRIWSKALYFMLQEVCRGKAGKVIRLAERFNGLHAWRL